MKEFMLFVKGYNCMQSVSPEEMQAHIQRIGAFIQRLNNEGRLKGVAPLESAGTTISGTPGNFTDGPFNETKEVISGYYHIVARDMDEAIGIAKQDPRFADGPWQIEVRPVLKMEGINA